MKSIDKKIYERITEIIDSLLYEKRITEEEANAILFYGLYNNSVLNHFALTLDEEGYPIINPEFYTKTKQEL